MIKYLFVTINSIALFFYTMFFDSGGVVVNGNFPQNIKPGSEVSAELIVKKGSMSGFAKLQIEVPEGFTVKESESKGGTFSFVSGIGKWIWTGLPGDAELTVKFLLVVDASVSGSKTIGAKYSYVENNNKVVIEMTPVQVMVGEGNVAAVVTETKTAETPTVQTENTSGTNTTSAMSETLSADALNKEPNTNISATRVVTKGTNPNEWNIDVKVKKANVKGFARYSDNLPEGFSAKQGKTNGSSFSVADNKIKFVWVNVPTTDEVEISYTLMGTIKTEITLEGEFSYLESNQSKSYKLSPEKITAPAAETPVVTNTETTQTTNTVVASTPTETTAAVATNTVAAENTNTVTATETNNPVATNTTSSNSENTQTTLTNNARTDGGNVSYCIQIGAFTNPNVSNSTLAGLYNISENIRSEMNGGYTKFLVGKFEEYKLARNHRENVKGKGVNGAFVTAYNGPKRITVQEALMISNQKWYR